MKIGIIGQFETWRDGETYAGMRGDIEKTAGLTVVENRTSSPHFAKWESYPPSRDGRSRCRVETRTREADGGARGVATYPLAIP
jgi:hypothetical protein